MNAFTLYGETFGSRLLLGTAAYPTTDVLRQAIAAAAPGMITVSLRRQTSGSETSGQSFWQLLQETGIPLLPNTAGFRNLYGLNTSIALFVMIVPVSSIRYRALAPSRCMHLLAAMLWVLILCPSSHTMRSASHAASSSSSRHADS